MDKPYVTTAPVPDGSRGRWLVEREMARLQGFPDDWPLPEDRNLACMTLGNSIHVGTIQSVIEYSLNVANDSLLSLRSPTPFSCKGELLSVATTRKEKVHWLEVAEEAALKAKNPEWFEVGGTTRISGIDKTANKTIAINKLAVVSDEESDDEHSGSSSKMEVPSFEDDTVEPAWSPATLARVAGRKKEIQEDICELMTHEAEMCAWPQRIEAKSAENTVQWLNRSNSVEETKRKRTQELESQQLMDEESNCNKRIAVDGPGFTIKVDKEDTSHIEANSAEKRVTKCIGTVTDVEPTLS